MKIAVTGGSGFIGQRLIAALEKDGHSIVNIDSTDAQNPIDITDKSKLSEVMVGCEAIYHLAAAHRDDVFPRSIYYDVNVGGTQNIIDVAKEQGIQKIIFASTVAVYGLNAGEADEATEPSPFNDYGKSKLEAEKILNAWQQEEEGRQLTIIRPVVVFGEGNRGNVYTLINQIARNKFIMIGKGQNKKSMAYVGNVAAFFHYCLNREEPLGVYNYADKPDLTTENLISTINQKFGKPEKGLVLPYPVGLSAGYAFDALARITGKSLPISSIRVKKFCADTVVNADKVHSSGFQTQYSLAEGIENMIAHDFNPQQEKAA